MFMCCLQPPLQEEEEEEEEQRPVRLRGGGLQSSAAPPSVLPPHHRHVQPTPAGRRQLGLSPRTVGSFARDARGGYSEQREGVRLASAPHSPGSSARDASARDASGRCDACDGDHDTALCPVYRRPREQHADAARSPASSRSGLGTDRGEPGPSRLLLHQVHVERQPGDGSCLFHSLCFGLGLFERGAAAALRQELVGYIARNGESLVAGTPLREWVLWDSGLSVEAYAARMRRQGEWGGALEMAVFAKLKNVNVHVFERSGAGYSRISCFQAPRARGGEEASTILVLYGGRAHYDALVARDQM